MKYLAVPAVFVVHWGVRLGIRAQLLLALFAVLLLGFVPLLFATASLTRAGVTRSWQRTASVTGELVGRNIVRAAAEPNASMPKIIAEAVGGEVVAIAVYSSDDTASASYGDSQWFKQLPERWSGDVRTTSRELSGGGGTAMLVLHPAASNNLAIIMVADQDALRIGPLVGLVALYTGLLGLALLVSLYLVLTRLVVTPVEQLSHAAARVADGARELRAPRRGGRELVELGSSLASMTATLVAEEQDLRQKVDELKTAADNLQQAQDKVVRNERLASVGRLAAGLAHEIGNPLAAILALQELLLDGDTLDTESRDFIERMKRETDRVHHVLRDLLTFARPNQKLDDESDPRCSVSEVVEHVVTLVRPQRAFTDVVLQVTVEDELPLAAMNPHHVEQVLLNLLLNAADAVPAPGGHVLVNATRHDDQLHLAVQDDGAGVDEAIAGRIFEPFVTSKDVGHGTGLGLAVCRGFGRSRRRNTYLGTQ